MAERGRKSDLDSAGQVTVEYMIVIAALVIPLALVAKYAIPIIEKYLEVVGAVIWAPTP